MSAQTSLAPTTLVSSAPLFESVDERQTQALEKIQKIQGEKSTARLSSGQTVTLIETDKLKKAVPTPIEANEDFLLDKKKNSHKPCFLALPFIWMGKAVVTVAKAIASLFRYIFSDTYEDEDDYDSYEDDLENFKPDIKSKGGTSSTLPKNEVKPEECVTVYKEPQVHPKRAPTIKTILTTTNREESLEVEIEPLTGLKRCRFAIQFEQLHQQGIDINQFLQDIGSDKSALEQAVNHFSLESCENLSTIQHLIKEISSNHKAVTDLLTTLSSTIHQELLQEYERAYETLKSTFKAKLQAHAQQAVQLVQRVHDEVEAQGIDRVDNQKLKHHYGSLECLRNHREQLQADGIDQAAVDTLLDTGSELFKALEQRVTPLNKADKRRSRSSSVDQSCLDNPTPGIHNIGNSCYMNSTIQVLESCPKLIEELRKPIVKDDWIEQDQFAIYERYQNAWIRLFDVIDYIRPQMKTANQTQQSQLSKVLEGEVWRLRNVLFFGRDVGEAFSAVQQQTPFHPDLIPSKGLTAQHDAAYLLEGLASLNKLLVNSHTKRRPRNVDMVYEKQSPSFSLSRVLQAAIPEQETSLQKIVEKEFGCEEVRDQREAYVFTLPDGKTEVRTPTYSQRSYFEGKAPAVFPLHLKRFSFDRQNNVTRKNQNPVELPEDGIVDLSFTFDTKQTAKYRIVGCVSHLGSSLGTGHYTSYVCQNGQWRHYDDSLVTNCTWDHIRTKAKTSAYILILEKVEDGASSKTHSPRANPAERSVTAA